MTEENTPSVTVKELDELVASVFAQRADIDESKAALTLLNKNLMALETKAMKYMEELDRTTYQSEFGTIYIKDDYSVKVPATPEDKQALFDHLKERGIFDRYATVNSKALNALFKEDFDMAIKRGELNFEMPGVGEKTLRQKFMTRKKG